MKKYKKYLWTLYLNVSFVINQFNIELLFQLRELVIKYSILLG